MTEQIEQNKTIQITSKKKAQSSSQKVSPNFSTYLLIQTM